MTDVEAQAHAYTYDHVRGEESFRTWDLVQAAFIAGYTAHMQDIAWDSDPRYERVDL
jgi:hypothetical protein